METLQKTDGRPEEGASADDGLDHNSVIAFKKMNSFRKKGQLCDVVIKAEGREFLAHRVVLAASSDYFDAMFSSGMAESAQLEIELKSISPEIMDALLDYVYTGQVRVSMDNVQDLLPAASLVQMEGIKVACSNFLLTEVDSTNVLGIRRFAELHNCIELEKFTRNYAAYNFESVVDSEEFVCLTHEELLDLVSREDLQIDSEESVYNAVMRWVYYQPNERVANLFPLLRNIRLAVISVRFLTDVVDKDPLIRQSLECRDLVDDAKRFHLRPDLRHEMRDQRFRQRDSGNEYLVVIGGFGSDDDPSDSVETFNPRTLEWGELPDLPISYRYVAACSLGTCVYVIGGCNRSERLNTVYFLDIAQQEEGWRLLSPMHYKRGLLAACTNKGLIYVCGGFDGQSRLRSLEVYHPKIDEWRILEEMTTAREGAGLVAVDDILYCLGGYDGFHLLNSMEAFDLHCGTWSTCKPMYMRRSGAGCALLGETIYVCGGYGGAEGRGPLHLDSVEAYNTRLDQWTVITSMNVPRCYVGACPLAGKIYVAAGYNGNRLLDTVESYDPIEDTWWLHEESRMNHERCDTGMCVVRFPVFCSRQSTPTTVTSTSRNFLTCNNVQTSLSSTVSSVCTNPQSTQSQSTNAVQSNDSNVGRVNTIHMNPPMSTGHTNLVSSQGSPFSASSRNALSAVVSESNYNVSQLINPSTSVNTSVANSHSPGHSHLPSTNRRPYRQVGNHTSRPNNLSSTAAVDGRDIRISRPPKHLLSLAAPTLCPGTMNIWNPRSIRFPYVPRGMHHLRNNRSHISSLSRHSHSILRSNATPLSHMSEQTDNPFLNNFDTLHLNMDNATSSGENYNIQTNESTGNSEFDSAQQTDQPSDLGNIDVNELCSHVNDPHFDQPTIQGSQLPASERSSCSSLTLVSSGRNCSRQCGSSSACKHELFRSVDAINHLGSDSIFQPISDTPAFSNIETSDAVNNSQVITSNEDPLHITMNGAQGDNGFVNVASGIVHNSRSIGVEGDIPDEHVSSNVFGDFNQEHIEWEKFSDIPIHRLPNIINSLTTKPKELLSGLCTSSSNDPTDMPCEQTCDVTLVSNHPSTSSVPIPIAKVKPCSSTVTENTCTTTTAAAFNSLSPTPQNTPQRLNDLSTCQIKQTLDTIYRRYRPIMPHSCKTDPIWPFRYNPDICQTQPIHHNDKVCNPSNDQNSSSSIAEMNDSREHSTGEAPQALLGNEVSHSQHLNSDDTSVRNLSEDPGQTGVSVKPDVTCTTPVIESVHLTDTLGFNSSNLSDPVIIDQPQNSVNTTSNCEPDITLCTVAYGSSNLNGNSETQPDLRSDGEGEEGDDLDSVQRNPAVGQVDDDL
uniref:BTB domain-containing protein n=1 Tax=Trichobilharzia regenti TaxID=157069 RepID=A0AA85JSN5_TRIRE|nr:unnamed protein product [Trichobilharzia regenti]